jgi:hypothetical protein
MKGVTIPKLVSYLRNRSSGKQQQRGGRLKPGAHNKLTWRDTTDLLEQPDEVIYRNMQFPGHLRYGIVPG